MEPAELTIMLAVGSVAGLGFLWAGIKSYRRRAMIVDIPRSTIKSLAMGLVEIHGRVKEPYNSQALKTPFSQTDCVHYSYKIEELRKSGKKSTRWVTIAGDSRNLRFIAADETGEVVVDPSQADFNLEIHREFKHDKGFFGGFSRFIERLSAWNQSDEEIIDSMPMNELEQVDPGGWNWYTAGDRRIREYCLEIGEKLFLIGTAVSDPERSGAALITKGANSPMYFIGDKSEKEMLSSLKWKVVFQFTIGLLLLGAVSYGAFRYF